VSTSFARLATVTASTKRPPSLAGGRRGEPVVNVATLKCTPLDPVDPELRERLALGTPHELLETFVDNDVDVNEGDVLVVGSREYPVRSVAEWTWRGTVYRHLILEDLKR
jgi:hypothetical protein